MGQKSDGQLGARNELIEAYEMFHKSYVNNRQARLDSSLEYVCDFIYPGVQISTQDSEFIGLDYVALANTGVISVDEARVALGLGEAEQKVVDSAQRIIESINSLSPLVANNVLSNMTINEKRALAGLAPIAGGDVLQAAPPADAAFKFNDFEKWHDDDLKVFAQFGEPENNFEPIKFNFAELSEKELAIMGAVNDNPKASIKEISTASRIAEDEVIKILRVLQDAGKIEWTNTAIKITDIGINDISDSGGTPRIELRYKYEVSPEAKPLKTQSRPFCIEMGKMNRLYTRQDIDQMTAILGYDVWRRRGGWYTVPDSEPAVHLPHCRHEWKQVYVRRRNNG
jgi:hypothetical protein